MSIIALGQGIPFFQAADDLLRSKSMDQNSYNSGDWFNRIDWSYQSNGWGSGLPIARENKKNWPVQKPLLANTALKPSPADIEFARKAFQEFLRIRQGSRLFRMQTVAEIQKNLLFFNNGPDQKPGLIVMQLKANGGNYGPFSTIVVGFNANRGAIVYQNPKLEGLNLRLHPVQSGSSDPLVRQAAADDAGGTLHIPGLTAAVFVVGG
jgi:pullulanase